MARDETVTDACDLESAQELADAVRQRLYGEGHPNPKLLRIEIDRLIDFSKATGQAVVACCRQLDVLERKRLNLNSRDAAARFDQAIAKLDAIRDRHTSLQALLVDTIRVARTALNRYEANRPGASRPPATKPSHPSGSRPT